MNNGAAMIERAYTYIYIAKWCNANLLKGNSGQNLQILCETKISF